MAQDEFRVAVVFSPTRLVSVGIVAGNYRAGCEYVLTIRPLLDEFIRRVRESGRERLPEEGRR